MSDFDLAAGLNAVAGMGFWPQVIYDDNGNWVIWDEGCGNIRLDEEQDYECSFLIPASYFKPSLQEAWEAYVDKLKELGNDVSNLLNTKPSASAEIARLTKELEEARKDAERYNWLCDTCVDFEEVSEGDGYTVKSLHFEYSPKMFLHEAIDQAMLSAAPDAAISKIGGVE